MSPHEIEKILNNMLKLSIGDPMRILLSWETADNLYSFFSGIDSDIYTEDPMSQYAPSECYSLSMSIWKELGYRINQNLPKAKREYKEFMEYQPTEEDYREMFETYKKETS